MHVHILTVGSRGDIEPLTALGAGLRRAGHRVALVANSEGASAAERAGLDFRDLQFSVRDMLRSHAGASILHGGSAHQSRSALVDAATAAMPAVGPRIIDASADADAIVSTETLHLLARSIADARGIPHIAASFAPYGRTAAWPSYYADTPALRSLPNLETHHHVQRQHHGRFLSPVNALRVTRLGLPALDVDGADAGREACPALLGYSPTLLPAPSDWPEHRHVTGYWPSADDSEPESALVDFVGDGDAPLYVGFGSMPYDVRAVADLLEAVTRRTGVRIVYATGWADGTQLPALPSGVFVTAHAPHRWLFPRVVGVVHHGGAGTTGTAVMAGTPSLIAWLIVDQVFWAELVARRGIGIDLGPFHALDAERLCGAVRHLQADVTLRARAESLRREVASEDGVANAVAAVERYASAKTAAVEAGL